MIISLLRLLLHPLFKWVYKYDFEHLEDTIKIHREVRAKNNEEIQDLKSKLDGFRYWEKNMKAVIKEHKWNSLALTPKDEIVIISGYATNMNSTDIALTNLRSRYGVKCCQLGSSMMENGHILDLLKKAEVNDDINSSDMVTVCDIQCSEKNNGYGSTLLSFFIEQARMQGIKIIGGWLSYALPDRDHHKELERFYKRLQFDVYFLPEGDEGVIIRRI